MLKSGNRRAWSGTRRRSFSRIATFRFDPTGLAIIEAGGFSSLLGKAFTEIAAASVSMHKSQGVGRPPQRGARKEYFKVLEGAPITNGLFDGVDATWTLAPKSETIAEKAKQLVSTFVPADPAASVPKLLELRKALTEFGDKDWAAQKRTEVDSIIAACLGLNIESSTTLAAVSAAQPLPIKFEAINRSKVPVQLLEVRTPVTGETLKLDVALPADQFVAKEISPTLPKDVHPGRNRIGSASGRRSGHSRSTTKP